MALAFGIDTFEAPKKATYFDIARKLRRWVWTRKEDQSDYNDGEDRAEEREEYDGPLSGAQLLGSAIAGKPGKHALVLDLDVPAVLVPSTTPGHSHLYVDVEVDFWQIEAVMKALVDARVLEVGYYNAALRRQATYVRTPWAPKDKFGKGVGSVVSVEAMALLGEIQYLEDKEQEIDGGSF